MNSNKRIAKIVGILFLTATVTSSLSIWITEPILESTNLLEAFSDKSSQIAGAAILMLIDAISVAFIAILLFPILKKKSESLTLGYVGMRIMEGILFAAYGKSHYVQEVAVFMGSEVTLREDAILQMTLSGNIKMNLGFTDTRSGGAIRCLKEQGIDN